MVTSKTFFSSSSPVFTGSCLDFFSFTSSWDEELEFPQDEDVVPANLLKPTFEESPPPPNAFKEFHEPPVVVGQRWIQ